MSDIHTIEIDLELHKVIEGARNNFNETASEILKRLIGAARAIAPEGKSWISKGAELPHGTQLRMTYNGKQNTAVIENGVWRLDNGESSTSPSAASWQVARTKKGGHAHVDGWHYWEALLPTETKWQSINKFRN